jgi:predicted nucleotidyltransferase
MVSLIDEHRRNLRDLCDCYHVAKLEVFGSAASGEFDPASSDVDSLVEFLPLPSGERADAYFGLLESLEKLFGRKVDLIMPRAIKNRYFLESVNRTRTIVYAA